MPLPMDANLSVEQRISQASARLTTAQKQLAQLVLQRAEHVLSMPINVLAEQSQVSVASVTRFVRALGFDSYADFRLRLARDVQSHSDAHSAGPMPQSADASLSSPDQQARQSMAGALLAEAALLQRIQSGLDARACHQAVQLTLAARRIWVYGAGSMAMMANWLGNELHALGLDAPLVCDAGGMWQTATRISTAQPGDLAIAISFPRYARDVVLLTEELRARKLDVLAITDGPQSPLSALTDNTLWAQSPARHGRFHSIVSVTAMLDAFLEAIYLAKGRNLENRLTQTEIAYPWLYTPHTPHPPPTRKTP